MLFALLLLWMAGNGTNADAIEGITSGKEGAVAAAKDGWL
jgi:hypothetical protein